MFRVLTAAFVLVLLLLGAPTTRPDAQQPHRAWVPGLSVDDVVSNPRTLAMGFSPFPFAATQEGLDAAIAHVREDGDLVNAHFDSGVPWEAAAGRGEYPVCLKGDIANVLRARGSGHVVLLQSAPYSLFRDAIAPDYGGGPIEPWASRDFDHPQVISAYVAYVRYLIDELQPDYVNLAIEANLLADKAPARWPAFLTLIRETRRQLQAAYPGLPLFMSVAVTGDFFQPAQEGVVRDILALSDIAATSVYPFMLHSDPAAMPRGFVEQVWALAPAGMPRAISETGWPAEILGAPFPVEIPATPATQLAYLDLVLAACDAARCEFLNWFLPRDYDALWEGLKSSPDAPLFRIWRDIGLWDGEGRERPALRAWREALARPRR